MIKITCYVTRAGFELGISCFSMWNGGLNGHALPHPALLLFLKHTKLLGVVAHATWEAETGM